MNPTDHRSVGPAPVLTLLLWLLVSGWAAPARAETTRCVDTVQELFDALDEAEAERDQMRINVVRGTYALPRSDSLYGGGGIHLVGGWDAGCNQRMLDPRLTVITGTGGLSISSFDFIRVESLAFVNSGYLSLNTYGGDRPTLELNRVWLENMCAGCDAPSGPLPVQLDGEYVYLTHVVAIDHPSVGCAVTIEEDGVREASVSYSLFTENSSNGLCVQKIRESSSLYEDMKVVVDNSLFWNNDAYDIFIESLDSAQVILRNNIYERLVLPEGSSITSLQNLDLDPQFQDVADKDFRPQASSPAVDSGRFALQLAQEFDLVGDRRLIGDAPDRGPFEIDIAESLLLVSNTQDTLSPVTTGSLRWAIEQANVRQGLDHIRFDLPGCPRIIELNAALPDITDSVFIDGYSQAGSERNTSVRGFTPTLCVGLRDSSLALDHALRIPAGTPDATLLWVSGLAFGGFDVAAVRIAAGSSSWVFGNQFGGSLGGTALGNNSVNVRLGGTSHDNLIGGVEVSQRNLISSAYSAGVELLDNSAGDEGHSNTVRNNFIGLEANGQDAAANALGVRVRSHRNRIEDNTISGNQGDGILIEGDLAFDNEIRDNAIGLKTFAFCLPPCTPDYALGNSGAGVRLLGGGDDNAIRFNHIRHNSGAGVRLEDGLRNLVYSNAISVNGALGIDLGTPGVNPVYNSGLAVTGTYANRGINAPTLSAASGSGFGGRVTGQLAGRNGVHLVEIFRNTTCDASGRGEGLQALTAGAVTISNAPIGDNGSANFDFALPANVALDGDTLTATVIDSDGDSSEFSACLAYETVLCREIFRSGFEDNPPPLPCTPL